MAIVNFSTIQPGLAGVSPQICYVTSTDTYATITAAGYLNNIAKEGNPISNGAFVYMLYGTPSNTPGIFNATVSNGIITLTEHVGVISGTTASWGGGGTSHAFTATGLTSSCVGACVIRTSTNAVAVAKALPSADTLTVTFTADPGAATTVDYIYTRAAGVF